MKKGKKTDTMKFSTDHRADLLTEALVNIKCGIEFLISIISPVYRHNIRSV